MDTGIATFYLDRFWFGVDVDRVQEVIRYQEITRVPLAPETVRGLINLRGQIVTALDLRQRLGLLDSPRDEPPVNLVVRVAGEIVSLLVDEIGDIVTVEREALEPPPENLAKELRPLVQGVCRLEDRCLIILDSERAVIGAGARQHV
jgi:purine-binding chemotaxis protein CheW